MRVLLDSGHVRLVVDDAAHAPLMDLRAGPARDDPGFEAAAMRLRRVMHDGFARVAVLVATHAGRLQILERVEPRLLSARPCESPPFSPSR